MQTGKVLCQCGGLTVCSEGLGGVREGGVGRWVGGMVLRRRRK